MGRHCYIWEVPSCLYILWAVQPRRLNLSRLGWSVSGRGDEGEAWPWSAALCSRFGPQTLVAPRPASLNPLGATLDLQNLRLASTTFIALEIPHMAIGRHDRGEDSVSISAAARSLRVELTEALATVLSRQPREDHANGHLSAAVGRNLGYVIGSSPRSHSSRIATQISSQCVLSRPTERPQRLSGLA